MNTSRLAKMLETAARDTTPDGERSNALNLAVRMLAAEGKTLVDIVGLGAAPVFSGPLPYADMRRRVAELDAKLAEQRAERESLLSEIAEARRRIEIAEARTRARTEAPRPVEPPKVEPVPKRGKWTFERVDRVAELLTRMGEKAVAAELSAEFPFRVEWGMVKAARQRLRVRKEALSLYDGGARDPAEIFDTLSARMASRLNGLNATYIAKVLRRYRAS